MSMKAMLKNIAVEIAHQELKNLVDRARGVFREHMEEALGKSTGTMLPHVAVEPPFTDTRGLIQNILHRPVGSIVLITSNPGSVRANHWHKTDWHYCYVLQGYIEYFERPVGSTERPKRYLFRRGDLFFTGPNVEHAMYFDAPTVFLTLAKNSREPKHYEEDLVRVPDLKAQWEKAVGEAPADPMDSSCGTASDER